MADRCEYRVTWQRKGQDGKRRALYQTLAGAKRCAKRQATAHDEMTWLDLLLEGPRYEGEGRPEPIIFGPIIEVRTVGEWSAAGEEDAE